MTYKPNEAEEIVTPPKGDKSPGDDFAISAHKGTVPPSTWARVMGDDDVPDDW